MWSVGGSVLNIRSNDRHPVFTTGRFLYAGRCWAGLGWWQEMVPVIESPERGQAPCHQECLLPPVSILSPAADGGDIHQPSFPPVSRASNEGPHYGS